MRREPVLLTRARNAGRQLELELGVVLANDHAASVAVAVERVWTARTSGSGPSSSRIACRRGSGSCRTRPPSSAARRSSPARPSRRAATAMAGGARACAGRRGRAPLWCVGNVGFGSIPATTHSAVEGFAIPPWTFAKADAAERRVFAHPTRMDAGCAGVGTSRPSREKSSCRLSGSGSPVDAAGPSPPAQLPRDRGSVVFREPGWRVTSKRGSSISPGHGTCIFFRCRFVLLHAIA